MTEAKMKKKSMMPYIFILAISVASSAVFAAEPLGILGIFCFALSVVLFSLTLYSTGNIFFVLPALLAGIIVFFVKHNIIMALLAVTYIPAGFYLSYLFVKKCTRMQIIVRLSFLVGIYTFLLYIFITVSNYGFISLNLVKTQIDDTLTKYIDSYETMLTRIYEGEQSDVISSLISERITKSTSEMVGEDGTMTGLFSEEDKINLKMNFLAILPAMALLSLLLISYIITIFFRFFYNILANLNLKAEKRKFLKAQDWELSPSLLSLITTMICLFLMFVLSNSENLNELIIVTNIFYINAAVYFLIGISDIRNLIRKYVFKSSVPSFIFTIIFLLILSFLFTNSLVLIIILIGLLTVDFKYYKKIKEKASKFIKDNFKDDDDDF